MAETELSALTRKVAELEQKIATQHGDAPAWVDMLIDVADHALTVTMIVGGAWCLLSLLLQLL